MPNFKNTPSLMKDFFLMKAKASVVDVPYDETISLLTEYSQTLFPIDTLFVCKLKKSQNSLFSCLKRQFM